MIQQSFKSIKDPKQLMNAFIEIQEKIGKQFHKYRELDCSSNRELRRKVMYDISQKVTDSAHIYEDLDLHLANFEP